MFADNAKVDRYPCRPMRKPKQSKRLPTIEEETEDTQRIDDCAASWYNYIGELEKQNRKLHGENLILKNQLRATQLENAWQNSKVKR